MILKLTSPKIHLQAVGLLTIFHHVLGRCGSLLPPYSLATGTEKVESVLSGWLLLYSLLSEAGSSLRAAQ